MSINIITIVITEYIFCFLDEIIGVKGLSILQELYERTGPG
jgi:hypothetical protein